MSAAAVAAPPPTEEPTDAEAPKKRGPPVVIIDSGNTNVAGGISGRALASRVKTFQDGSNVWVREKTEETDAPEVVEARREALRAKAVIGDGEGVELDAEKAKQEALGGVSEETMDKTAREIQCFRLAAFDVNIDELEVKEWLRPDADPSDYFNYGMGEDTWRQYRDQQLILRRSLQERRAAMAQAAARERHAELLKQGPPQPPTLPMPIMGGGPRPPWGGPMPPPNAFPPRGFPGQVRDQCRTSRSRPWRRRGCFAREPFRDIPFHTGLSSERVPAELSRPKYALAAGRADVSSAAGRLPGRTLWATGGAGPCAGAFSKTFAVARAVAAAATKGGLM